MKRRTNAPTEGLTRCSCGSKYWDREQNKWKCHSCKQAFKPQNTDGVF